MAVPTRTQYCFDLSGVRFKSAGEIIKMRNQWDTFERIENHNDIIYQRFLTGRRDELYYQFRNRQELEDYRRGQALHIARYPEQTSTFTSISERPLPDVPIISQSQYSQVSRCVPPMPTKKPSELLAETADLTTYVHVSTFNAQHVYKYNFKSNEEQLAYHRAERRILCPDLAE